MHILILGIWFLVKTLILTVLLWIMIKIQKLNCKYLWLIGAAAVGTALDMIPYAGHYLAVPATIFGIWKCTKAEVYPDAVFTVVVAGALMFCVNLFILGALMGNLSTSPDETAEMTSLLEEEESHPTNKVKQAQAPKSKENTNAITAKTNPPVVVAKTNPAPAKPLPAPARTNVVKTALPVIPPKDLSYKSFSLIGVGGTLRRPLAMVRTGTKTYTVEVGEEVSMLSPQGRLKVRCEAIENKSVLLIIEGKKLELFL